MSDLTKDIFSKMQTLKDCASDCENRYAKLFYTEPDAELAAVYEIVRQAYLGIEIDIRDRMADLKRVLEEGDDQ